MDQFGRALLVSSRTTAAFAGQPKELQQTAGTATKQRPNIAAKSRAPEKLFDAVEAGFGDVVDVTGTVELVNSKDTFKAEINRCTSLRNVVDERQRERERLRRTPAYTSFAFTSAACTTLTLTGLPDKKTTTTTKNQKHSSTMNNPESGNPYRPKQALAPTPQLYDELVGDGMENLAKATVAEMLPMPSGSTILDDGCGTGAGTTAIVAHQRERPGRALSMPDATFSHAIGTAFLFVLPEDGVSAVQNVYRTLKPGGVAALNSWAYVPNMRPIQVAAERTRPEGTPLPRGGLDKWEDPEFLQRVIREGGFAHGNITLTKRDVHVTTTSVDRYATMLWSFIGGTSTAGWLESDEARWDEAIAIVKEELRKSDGYKELEGGRLQLKFVANVAIAKK
ncbi:hypothetical protein K504DRAFT_505738 [Pleomassaria siparia CBS 279.74]|uniref:S-adenosyl-L-methionine-dependent methyltransferase n=1 Tax=Pleomassaria siparia CBS 279.74 TaxID=1314801 RepID=A0A6G1JZV6_9PLEO|nr:hypothetical protein K504DRAFT_505738 [Pleomassaria siparia CBS 279.74]